MNVLHTLSKHFSACAATFINTTTADGCKEVSFGHLVYHIMYSNHTHICTTTMNDQVPPHRVVITAQ